MNDEDSTSALLQKTDAFIAKHRQPRETEPSISEGTSSDAEVLPTLTQKLSSEEASALIKQSALQAAQENADMQKAVDEDAPKIPSMAEIDPWDDSENISNTSSSTQVSEGGDPAAENLLKPIGVLEPAPQFIEAVEVMPNAISRAGTDLGAGSVAQIDAAELAKVVSPELAQLVSELTKEVSSAVFRQMLPGLQAIIENRIRAVVEDAVKQASTSQKE